VWDRSRLSANVPDDDVGMTEPSIRAARPSDVDALHRLIVELAVYEREPDAVEATVAQMTMTFFPSDGEPRVHALVAEVDETIVGMAIWYVTYSTWLGRHGIWLEDLFVSPSQRGSGTGKALLTALAGIVTDRGYGRLEWLVLRWNEPSIGFYDSLGAKPMDDWLHYRLDGAELTALAASRAAGGR
jgi:GNAT superfamily N-acetyltransferase